jgi:3-hydroxyacyl-CoA dehydrogenase
VRCIDAIEGAGGPFEAGLANERRMFVELMQTPESQSLRHAFFAERAAGKIDGIPESTAVRKVDKAAVIGAGTMGSGISICFLNAGIPVWLLEMSQEALDKGVARIAGIYDGQVRKGKLAQAERDRRMALISPTLSYGAIAQADIVIEAVFESMEVKQQVFTTLDRVMKRGAILATNTSTLDVNKIAAFTKRPQDVVGTHFFSPANVMRLLEIVRGTASAPDVLATALKLGKTLRKVAVVSGVCDGFIGNRMLEQYAKQAIRDGAVSRRRSRRQRHQLGDPQAPAGRAPRLQVLIAARQALRARALRPEDRRRLVRLPGGSAQTEAIEGRRGTHQQAPRRERRRAS